MNQLKVGYTGLINKGSSIDMVREFMEKQKQHSIQIEPWPSTGEKPTVLFSLAHGGDCLFIRFQVKEEYVAARYKESNDPVYRDSCVEFFISMGDEKAYYNFEFNNIGTCLMGYGNSVRTDRTYLPSWHISKINRKIWLHPDTKGKIPDSWELTAILPIDMFCFSSVTSFKGLRCRGNFYKCGDDLPQPHYLVWNEIKAPQPDFHQPDFFGLLLFQ